MEKRSEGAWLINHTNKLLEVKNSYEFEDIELAGKCGLFLSNLAESENQSDLNADKVKAIAKVSNIKKTEIDTIKAKLSDSKLIDIAKNGSISVLGVSTASVLGHTSDIFNNDNPSSYQRAALDLSENISDLPKGEKTLSEYISDTYRLSTQETVDLLMQSEDIGFIDYEELDDKSKYYFNGNLFRRENLKKTNAVLSSLKADDQNKIIEIDQLLTNTGCITYEKGIGILGPTLMSKLMSIGMYDLNEVSNVKESRSFITKPSAFAKFGNPFEEDALDLAKSFVSALFYGMNYSSQGRGKITMLKALLNRLVNGYEVGPATAIGQDYKLLELRRVIQIRKASNSSRYYMKLLKKDVGILAMQVLEFGDASEQTLVTQNVYSGSITKYVGPENWRTSMRKKQNKQTKREVTDLLRTFRS